MGRMSRMAAFDPGPPFTQDRYRLEAVSGTEHHIAWFTAITGIERRVQRTQVLLVEQIVDVDRSAEVLGEVIAGPQVEDRVLLLGSLAQVCGQAQAALPVHTAPEGQAIQLAWQTIGAPQLISRAGSLSVIAPAYGDDAMNNSGLCLHVDAQFTSPYAMSCFTALREKGIEFEWSPLDLDSL